MRCKGEYITGQGWVKKLLLLVTEEIPPGDKQRHSITVVGGILELCLFLGDKYYPFRFEREDDEKPIEQLVMEIKAGIPEEALQL